MIDRGAQLSKFHRLLNTDDGKELMADLKIAWGSANVFSSDIATMAYNAALLEAYRALESYQLAEDLQR
tara:strand:+ start:3119 stop:3325 length:207 start_codon:yes stop_codon:yes gene_type:complete